LYSAIKYEDSLQRRCDTGALAVIKVIIFLAARPAPAYANNTQTEGRLEITGAQLF